MAERWSVRTEADGRVRIVVASDFDLAVEEPFVALVAEQLAAGHRRVLVDLGAVEFIDSSGVRALLRVHIDHPHQIELVDVPEVVTWVLRVAGLDRVLVDGDDG
jgi:anti-sigma B factor antagonist